MATHAVEPADLATELRGATMDLMLLGETVRASATGQTSEGFWMPAGGNDGVGGVEVFFQTTTNAFDVHVDTKSSDQDDTAAASIGSVTLATVTATAIRYKFDLSDAKDLVRYRVVSLKAATVHLQFAQPLWSPN